MTEDSLPVSIEWMIILLAQHCALPALSTGHLLLLKHNKNAISCAKLNTRNNTILVFDNHTFYSNIITLDLVDTMAKLIDACFVFLPRTEFVQDRDE